MRQAILCPDSPLLGLLNNKAKADNISECLTCGICNSRCTWFDGEGGPVPRQMIRMAQMGLDDLLAQSPMIWDCMICNHCTVDCPMGIEMEYVVRRARSLPAARKNMPAAIAQGLETRLTVGDVNGFTHEDFIETIDWLNEEIEDENPAAVIPTDQKGVKYLYLPNPRELGTNVLHLQLMAGLFHAFGEPWTMSHRHTDVTNWGYFVGDDDIERKMLSQVVEATEELGVENLVLSECGHGFLTLRHHVEELLGRKPGFKVISIIELTLDMVVKGVIKLDKEAHPFAIGYHDPCNLGRKAGVYDAPRELLAHACREVIELVPNRLNSVCCGGGGALLQDSTSKDRRMIAGKAKADQIRKAGVDYIATGCLSCHRQLTELSQHFNLGTRVETVVATAAAALV